MAAVSDCGSELVDHPPYSLDLAPFDYILFPNMIKHLAGKQYRTDDKVISAVEDFLEDMICRRRHTRSRIVGTNQRKSVPVL